MEAIQKFGAMVKSPNGYPIQSPYVAIANRQAEIVMRDRFRVRLHPGKSKSNRNALTYRTYLFDRAEDDTAQQE